MDTQSNSRENIVFSSKSELVESRINWMGPRLIAGCKTHQRILHRKFYLIKKPKITWFVLRIHKNLNFHRTHKEMAVWFLPFNLPMWPRMFKKAQKTQFWSLTWGKVVQVKSVNKTIPHSLIRWFHVLNDSIIQQTLWK